jgi:hypothetical protein
MGVSLYLDPVYSPQCHLPRISTPWYFSKQGCTHSFTLHLAHTHLVSVSLSLSLSLSLHPLGTSYVWTHMAIPCCIFSFFVEWSSNGKFLSLSQSGWSWHDGCPFLADHPALWYFWIISLVRVSWKSASEIFLAVSVLQSVNSGEQCQGKAETISCSISAVF